MGNQNIPSFIEFCVQTIIDALDEHEGNSYYGGDLAGDLTDYMRCDGTFTYNTEKAKAYLMEWWGEAAEFSDYEDLNFGKRSNPFENVELFLVRMVCEGCSAILAQCPLIDKFWDKKMKLNKKNIRTIKKFLDEDISNDSDLW